MYDDFPDISIDAFIHSFPTGNSMALIDSLKNIGRKVGH